MLQELEQQYSTWYHENIAPLKCVRVRDFEALVCTELYETNASAGGTSKLDALPVALGVARGLHYLHVVEDCAHGNLKPSNVLVSPSSGEVRLSDAHPLRCSAATDAGLGDCGHYTAPEVKVDFSAFTKASDIYCLGIIVGELLAGSVHSVAPVKLGAVIHGRLCDVPRVAVPFEDFADASTANASSPIAVLHRVYVACT